MAERNCQPSSASSSVSGRGTRTCRFTAISWPQNEVEPMMCWSGSRWPRRLTSSRKRIRFRRRQHAVEIQIQFHARHLEQMREEQLRLQARRLDVFFGEKFGAFLNRFEDGHDHSLCGNERLNNPAAMQRCPCTIKVRHNSCLEHRLIFQLRSVTQSFPELSFQQTTTIKVCHTPTPFLIRWELATNRSCLSDILFALTNGGANNCPHAKKAKHLCVKIQAGRRQSR